MNGPGFSLFAVDDAAIKTRQPSLYRVESTYTANAKQAAQQQQLVMTGITAGIALLAIMWASGRK